jgi:hypothetical protein
LPPQTIDAQAGDSTKRLVIDLGLTAVRQVRGLEFMPGDRRVVRAATFSLEGTGQWLGSWTPWHGFVRLPDGVAYRLPARSRIVADIHYRGTREQATDRSTIGLFFAAAPAARAPTDLVLDARPAAEPGSSTATVKLSSETRVWAVQPDIAAGLTTLEVSTRRPDGGTDVLLALTAPSAEWPTPYLLKTPRLLSRGTEVFLVARSSTTQPRQVRVRLSRY